VRQWKAPGVLLHSKEHKEKKAWLHLRALLEQGFSLGSTDVSFLREMSPTFC